MISLNRFSTSSAFWARALRKFALGLGRRAAPFRRLVMAGLTQDGGDMPFGGVRRAWVRLRPR